ncbi:hypothetical protein D1816_02930 [Aquimarina sp. AD10]|uniref:Uncharacterized protein n=1 Tax=Aquimarina aggregata TaxID=1642818 RepID=A0A163CQF3_9FLAO|nr:MULTISPECIES: hypothetical protein [Aquimarina]AXT59344.1 hypothetical protein D1816_02930 [Aquimarina sp. AD10]KZS42657.1 hypothetical protein AWE51_04200 [Aquimarina aggregata]RKM91904.1 hypothetical protein D7033_21615 [Aquimarina sp. AD10]
MKSKKTLSLKKVDIAKLDTIKGGNLVFTSPNLPTANPNGCGNGTQGLACQYSQTPMSCVVCVHVEK